jgi:DHA1 family tetracycline resistance protein-like MFS transporter
MIQNRKLIPIFLIVLIDILGLTIILPLLPFYAEKYGASPFIVGMLVSAYALCQLISGPVLGQWSDHIGRKPLLILSQLGTFMGFVLLAFSHSLVLIFVSRIIDGLTAGNLSLAQAYISDVTEPKDRAAAFGKIGVAFGIGFFLGPALTAFLYRFGYQAPILAAAALSATSILATTYLLPGGAGPAAKAAHPKKPLFAWGHYLSFFKRPALTSLLLQMLLFYFAFSAYVSGFALFAERRFTWHGIPLGPKQVGYLFAYFGFLGIILQGVLMGKLVKRFGERNLAWAGFSTCTVGYILLCLIHTPFWIIVTGLFTGFGNGVIRPVLMSEISRNVDRTEQGVVLGLNQSLNSVAQIVAPLIGTSLISHDMLNAWTLFPAALCLIALVLIMKLQPIQAGHSTSQAPQAGR